MVNAASPGIAAVTWKHEDREIRVYFQKDDGFIYEAAWNEGTLWNSEHTKLIQAKPNTPLAAIVYMPWQPEIRLYYLDTLNVLQECIYSTLKDGWQNGSVLPAASLNPITTLAALTWARSTNQEIRVFYQKTDDTIQELIFSSSWSVGSSFTDKAYPGTSLSATTVKKDNIRTHSPAYHIFWQAPTTFSLNEYIWSGTEWSTRLIKYTPPPALSGISAIGWMDKAGQSHINVFMEKEAGDGYFLWQMVTYGDKAGWTFFGFQAGDKSIKSQTPISVVGWVEEKQEEYRMYAWTSGQELTTGVIGVVRPQPLTAFPGVRECTTEVVKF